MKVLSFLRASLSFDGLLVFTTHGRIVEDRLRRRERTYNLSEENVNSLLFKLDTNGYGFAPYTGMDNYGISVSSPWRIAQMSKLTGLSLIQFQDRAWAAHQDVFCAMNWGSDKR